MSNDTEVKQEAPQMDWQQVVLNGGPPCFSIEEKGYCGRAQRWEGHDYEHKFVSLDDLLATVRREEREAAFKEASRIIDNLSTRRTDNTDRYVTASAFQTRASCALERAALEASANQKGEVNG